MTPSPPASALPPMELAILASVHDAVVATDHGYNITFWNAAAERTYGWRSEEVLGRSVTEVLSTVWESDAVRDESVVAVCSTGAWHGEVSQLRKDGQRVSIMSSVTVLSSSGEPIGLVAVNRDITALRQTEAALAQAEARLTEVRRLDALGELAGSVAHDFNNLLAIVAGRAELVLHDLPPGSPGRASVAQILSCAERGAVLSRQLLSFGKRDSLDVVAVELGSMIRGIDEVLRRMVGDRNRLKLLLPTDPVFVRASRGELEQVLLNLCANARDAMNEPGLVLITLTVSAGRVGLVVSDSGHGMTADVRARAFEPFFTTKTDGKGAGLGLTVVSRVVARHGGTVQLESGPGQGTRVVLNFPPARAGERLDEPPSGGSPVRARVLLAEDQQIVREVIESLLRSLGHDVVAVADGQAAVEAAVGREFDVFVTDVSMPRMSGPDAALELRKTRPNLPVVFLSGFPKDQTTLDERRWPAAVFRLKPVRREDLRAALERVGATGP